MSMLRCMRLRWLCLRELEIRRLVWLLWLLGRNGLAFLRCLTTARVFIEFLRPVDMLGRGGFLWLGRFCFFDRLLLQAWFRLHRERD